MLEIGCFTGYGTLAMALALPPDGRVLTLDVNPDWAELGRRAWREAGVEAGSRPASASRSRASTGCSRKARPAALI